MLRPVSDNATSCDLIPDLSIQSSTDSSYPGLSFILIDSNNVEWWPSLDFEDELIHGKLGPVAS
jgi:hypothetical protein